MQNKAHRLNLQAPSVRTRRADLRFVNRYNQRTLPKRVFRTTQGESVVKRRNTIFFFWLFAVTAFNAQAQKVESSSDDQPKKRSTAEKRRLAEVVNKAFRESHDGWSSDEVVLNDELNNKFIAACREQLPDAEEKDFNWTLLNLRKAGKLDAKTTRRRNENHDEYLHAAEVAARYMHDKYAVTTDRVFSDPLLRAEFDKVAQAVAPEVSAYQLRKATLRLRKNRQLKPELIVRIADWGREIHTLPAEMIVKKPEIVPTRPGIYIFRDESGYLYIGESSNLRLRVEKHLDHSDRKSLAHYLWENGNKKITVELHAFDPESKAKDKTVRRAYESELIRSREPRFNITP